MFDGKVILITGGGGSLGSELVKRIVSAEFGTPKKVIVYSRDEDKHYRMKLHYKNLSISSDDVYYRSIGDLIEFRIGDVRDYEALVRNVKDSDIIIHAAALKHVPVCEYFGKESIQTNILGALNIIRALRENNNHVECCVVISTDKACKPVNVYGMCKAIQERVIIEANLQIPNTRFICVRYGNVVASSGSVIPLFLDQIKNQKFITITDPTMTRFWLTLKQASDIVFDAIKTGEPGDTFIPDLDAFNVLELAKVMIGNRDLPIKIIGIRPGEKIHEILISEEEIARTIKRGDYYIIQPILPELRQYEKLKPVLSKEFSSVDKVLGKEDLKKLLVDFILPT